MDNKRQFINIVVAACEYINKTYHWDEHKLFENLKEAVHRYEGDTLGDWRVFTRLPYSRYYENFDSPSFASSEQAETWTASTCLNHMNSYIVVKIRDKEETDE